MNVPLINEDEIDDEQRQEHASFMKQHLLEEKLFDDEEQIRARENNSLRKCRIIGSDGVVITTEAEWAVHAKPKKENHWKPYRSARETCRAWLRDGPAVPIEMFELLNTRPETRCFNFEDVFPEHIANLDSYAGEQRNEDVHATASRGKQKLVLGVESKADEEFGAVIGPYLDAAVKKNAEEGRTRFSNIPKRIDTLVRAIFGRPVDDDIRKLQYQLLYGIAAPVIHADRNGIGLAVFLVHEFVSTATMAAKLAKNAKDLSAFICQIPGWEFAEIEEGKLLHPIKLPGWKPMVTIGKVRIVLE